ncbi:MAG: FtsW/RodA/SpoVE family cell cycle protein, partial [Oscillospiraceae bacterium]
MKAFLSVVKKLFKQLDKVLLFLAICASAISCTCMYSFYKNEVVSSRVFLIQVLAVVIGIIAACVISQLDYKILARLWKFHLPATLALTLLTFTPLGAGNEVTGGSDDKAWINLGFTTLQPSELLKLSFIFTFALHLSKVGTDINKPKNFLLLCLHGALPVGIIVLQKDLGSALVFVAIFIIMMFAGGLSAKLITVGILGGIAAAPFVWNYLLPPYLQQRFIVAWHPEIDKLNIGNQQYNGRIAIGSGGLNG